MSELVVCCFFWIDPARRRSYQFTAEDVRIWDRMIARNLKVPHRRVCVTHRPDLIRFMDTIQLDPEKHVPGTCCVKLQAHKPGGIAREGERILLMDIDCAVTGHLDPLVHRHEAAVWWRNPNYTEGGRRGYIQGSMQLFTVGATDFLWREFDPLTTPVWLNRRFGGAEQAWISERLNTDYPEPGWHWDVPTWTDVDGVYGASRLINGEMDVGLQSDLPENARIVFFPGNRSPRQPEVQLKHTWIKDVAQMEPIRMPLTAWIRDQWRRLFWLNRSFAGGWEVVLLGRWFHFKYFTRKRTGGF